MSIFKLQDLAGAPEENEQSNTGEVDKATQENGIHFTPLATAVLPFSMSLTPPFTLNVNFTPSADLSDGSIALLVIPDSSKFGYYSFVRLAISSGYVELR